jgi:hypothetical protein
MASQPVVLFDHAATGAEAFRELAGEILARLGGK